MNMEDLGEETGLGKKSFPISSSIIFRILDFSSTLEKLEMKMRKTKKMQENKMNQKGKIWEKDQVEE